MVQLLSKTVKDHQPKLYNIQGHISVSTDSDGTTTVISKRPSTKAILISASTDSDGTTTV